MKHRVVALVATCLVLACSRETENVQGPARTSGVTRSSWVSDITTARPIDPGAVHNAVLARFNARLAAPGGMNYDEYVLQLQRAANKALAPYGVSRELTIRDCEMAIGLAVTAVDPYYDLTYQDPERSDPLLLLNHWLDRGYITQPEFARLADMFLNHNIPLVSPNNTESEAVLAASSVLSASIEYWTGTKSRPLADGDWQPPVKELRNTLADGFGGLIGALLGGPIGAGLTGMVTSTIFIMDRPGGWCIACGPGRTGDSPPLPPCDGYTGIGPCPD